MASCLFDTDFMGFKTCYEREERGHGKCNLVMVRLTETWIQTLRPWETCTDQPAVDSHVTLVLLVKRLHLLQHLSQSILLKRRNQTSCE